jgi:hypothetical protein
MSQRVGLAVDGVATIDTQGHVILSDVCTYGTIPSRARTILRMSVQNCNGSKTSGCVMPATVRKRGRPQG